MKVNARGINRRRAVWRLLGVASLPSVLAACGQPGNEAGGPSAPPSVVELRHQGTAEAQVARWTALFGEAQASLPKIALRHSFESTAYWDKLQVEHAAGTGPDVTYNQVNWYIAGGARGIFQPLDQFMLRDKVKRQAYNKGALESWLWKDRLYGIPYSAIGEAVFLYKKLFREMAVPVPGPAWTWDDLLSAARKLTKGEGTSKQFGVVLFNNSLQITQGTWILNNGGKILNETRDKALYGDDPKAIEAFQWLVDLRLRHAVEPKPDEQTPDPSRPAQRLQPMNEGRAAMEIARFSRYNEWIEQLGAENVEILPVPAGPGNRRSSAVGTNAWSVGGHSKTPDAAWEVVKWLTGPQGQGGKNARIASVPALTTAATSKEFLDLYAGTKIQETFDAWAKDSRDYLVNSEATEAWAEHAKQANPALEGLKSARQALKDSADALNVIFARRPADLR